LRNLRYLCTRARLENIEIEGLEINTVTRFDVVPDRIARQAESAAEAVEAKVDTEK
jgi:hypothetical protein